MKRMLLYSTKIGFLFLGTLGMIAGCSDESGDPSATEKALQELQAKYDELTSQKIEDPTQWAADDIENIGDWEYKIEELPYDSSVQLEEALNKLGDERWEVFWIERTNDGYLVLLKKPAVSYLSKIPLSQIGRFVIGGPDAAN